MWFRRDGRRKRKRTLSSGRRSTIWTKTARLLAGMGMSAGLVLMSRSARRLRWLNVGFEVRWFFRGDYWNFLLL